MVACVKGLMHVYVSVYVSVSFCVYVGEEGEVVEGSARAGRGAEQRMARRARKMGSGVAISGSFL
jgi:hypothetical protein